MIYRKPSTPPGQFLEQFGVILQNLDKKCKICISGDFNLNLLKYNENQYVNLFLNMLYSSNFYPAVNKPTRVSSLSATLIDNILLNYECPSYRPTILLSDLSDHFSLSLCCPCDKVSTETGNEFIELNMSIIAILHQKTFICS